MTPAGVQALERVLAAQHAVVYGYGVAGARLRGRGRNRARSRWNHHRAKRDELSALLTELGGQPVQAAATYVLPGPVETPADARALVTQLEEGLTAAWADAVLALPGDRRGPAVDGMRESAVAAALWRGGSVAFPGLAERSSDHSEQVT